MQQVHIYISDLRGEAIFNGSNVKSTLNYHDYVSPHRLPIGALLHVNEWAGDGINPIEIPVSGKTINVLIPLSGNISINTDTHSYAIPLGNLLVHSAEKAQSLAISSTEARQTSSFLQLVFLAKNPIYESAVQATLPITNPSNRNSMVHTAIKQDLDFTLYARAFMGKSSFQLHPSTPGHHFFAFVLDGSMEVEERMLYPGDSLSLEGYTSLEIECLSGTGILLLLHF